jgi:hypothetical protein
MIEYVLLSYSLILLLVYSSYFQEKTSPVYAKVCNVNTNGNVPQSSCGSSRQFHSGDSRTQASDRTDDGTNGDNSYRTGKHEDSNHDSGDVHDDNHRNGGHDSKDDIPFNLPFP